MLDSIRGAGRDGFGLGSGEKPGILARSMGRLAAIRARGGVARPRSRTIVVRDAAPSGPVARSRHHPTAIGPVHWHEFEPRDSERHRIKGRGRSQNPGRSLVPRPHSGKIRREFRVELAGRPVSKQDPLGTPLGAPRAKQSTAKAKAWAYPALPPLKIGTPKIAPERSFLGISELSTRLEPP